MMKIYATLKEDNRINTYAPTPDLPDAQEIEIPEGLDLGKLKHYRVDGSELVYDPLPEEEPEPIEPYASKQDLLQTQIALAEVFETMIAMMGGM